MTMQNPPDFYDDPVEKLVEIPPETLEEKLANLKLQNKFLTAEVEKYEDLLTECQLWISGDHSALNENLYAKIDQALAPFF